MTSMENEHLHNRQPVLCREPQPDGQLVCTHVPHKRGNHGAMGSEGFVHWPNENDEIRLDHDDSEPLFQDTTTGEPCPRVRNRMCTISDADHRHVSISVAAAKAAETNLEPSKFISMDSEAREGNLGEVIDGRTSVYGEVIPAFTRQAQAISAVLNHEVQPWEVPLIMIAIKMIRTTEAPDYSDNSDDIEGYLDIFRQLIGEDMVHARSVKEYVEERSRRSHL